MDVVLYFCEFLTYMIPASLMFVFQALVRKTNLTGKRIVLLLLFALYLFAVLHVTGIATIFSLFRDGFVIDPDRINLIPFSRPGTTAFFCILNVILFVPLGIFLPMLWPKKKEFLFVSLFGIGFSMLIELTQLLSYRATDIDDLIMNSLGAVIGYGIYWLVRRSRKKKRGPERPRRRREPNRSMAGAALFILAVFLFHCLTFDEMFFARVLYGF